ncbi:hypothetical protein WICMUC_003997 [Wickerhamomyces mucosus]|uniref:Uncharacterized protein n=1 Tax=Wickerhamomyces mucosus TaxID=1378264 RepID=A0A9P8PJX8_9ASCO|nr:hypothetical protein WICMUC_003997 [Wickerhamomyces mucosus]
MFLTYLLKTKSIFETGSLLKLSRSRWSSQPSDLESTPVNNLSKTLNPNDDSFSRNSGHSFNGICKLASADVTNALLRAVLTSEVIPESKLIVNA